MSADTGFDMVNRPAHYADSKIECIDAIQEAVKHLNGFEGSLTGNVIKYIWRWKKKNGKQDLEKARWYLNKLIDSIE